MTDYRIVCISVERPTEHEHVTAVGIGIEIGEPRRHLTMSDLSDHLDKGSRFYVYNRGETAGVEMFTCGCGYSTIRSTAPTMGAGLMRVPTCTHAANSSTP
jgi:hypothetical protein